MGGGGVYQNSFTLHNQVPLLLIKLLSPISPLLSRLPSPLGSPLSLLSSHISIPPFLRSPLLPSLLTPLSILSYHLSPLTSTLSPPHLNLSPSSPPPLPSSLIPLHYNPHPKQRACPQAAHHLAPFRRHFPAHAPRTDELIARQLGPSQCARACLIAHLHQSDTTRRVQPVPDGPHEVSWCWYEGGT